MIRPILKMGDPRLLQVAQPVTAFGTPELRQLLDDMFDTMQAADGAGLAAPQIGVPLRVVIFGSADGAPNPRYPDEPPVPRTILVNPLLQPLDEAMEEGWEGCLSVPGLRGVVPRHRRLRYSGFDPEGRPIERTAEGFHARVVQHECDHLDGILYPMRVRDLARFGFTEVLFPELAGAPSADD
jgi:peptide deformylase